MVTLTFIDRIIEKDFANTVLLLKHEVLKKTEVAVPVWNSSLQKAEMRAVTGLAGLLCYTDPVTQCKGLAVGDFLTNKTRRLIMNALIMTTDMGTQMGKQMKLE